MKTLIAALCLLVSPLFAIPPTPGPTIWNLAWQPIVISGLPWDFSLTNYVPKTNAAWIVSASTNLSQVNFTNWGILTLVTNWSNAGNGRITANVTVPYAAQWFFSVQATNFQGVTPPCIPDTTGPLLSLGGLQITNGQ